MRRIRRIERVDQRVGVCRPDLWAPDGTARMKQLLGKVEESPTGNWEERFMLLQAVEGNKAGTIFKDIQVETGALPRIEPPCLEHRAACIGRCSRTCAGGRGCQHGHAAHGAALMNGHAP
jgi:hypothetical protein